MEGRKPLTCGPCAKQKIKCDRNIPCSRCHLKGITCIPRYSCRSKDWKPRSRDKPQSYKSTGSPVDGNPDSGLQQFGSLPTPTLELSFLDMDMTGADHQRNIENGMHYDLLDHGLGSDEFDGMMNMPNGFFPDYINQHHNLTNAFGFPDMMELSDADAHAINIAALQAQQHQQHRRQIPHEFDQSGSSSPTPVGSLTRSSVSSSASFTLDALSMPYLDRSSSRQKQQRPETPTTEADGAEHFTIGQDYWSAFQCNPRPVGYQCPKSAEIYLMGLERTLRDQNAWTDWDACGTDLVDRDIVVKSFSGITRDVLVALTQEFLQKAIEIHRVNLSSNSARFIILPPQEVLSYFIRATICRHRSYYPMFSSATLNPTDLVQIENEKAGSLFFLMLISQGAMATPTTEARYLASGLIEVCRISLFDLVEKDINLASNRLVLQCALLFTVAGAWSGDKWQMDIALGQRGMYLAMLAHSKYLESSTVNIPFHAKGSELEAAWEAWKEQEHRSRLVYSWVVVDLELSFFYETTPMLSVKSLDVKLPSSEALWQAASATEWQEIYERDRESYERTNISLSELFRAFIDGQLDSSNVILSPTHLNLLLHPIQALSYHLQQFLSCFSNPENGRGASRAVSKSAIRVRLEEIQALLQNWLKLFQRSERAMASSHESNGQFQSQLEATMCVNSIWFSMLFMNTIVSFVEIERVAACGSSDTEFMFANSMWHHTRNSGDSEEIFVYCGQILRLLASLPESSKPAWWAAAVYRVALIAWANSQMSLKARYGRLNSNSDTNLFSKNSASNPQIFQSMMMSPTNLTAFPIDNSMQDDDVVVRYLKNGEGTPMLTKDDGTLLNVLDRPVDILWHCAGLLRQNSKMRFTVGLATKLEALAKR